MMQTTYHYLYLPRLISSLQKYPHIDCLIALLTILLLPKSPVFVVYGDTMSMDNHYDHEMELTQFK